MILELGAGGDILRAIGAFYWLLAVGGIGVVFLFAKSWWVRTVLTLVVLAVFIAPPYKYAIEQKAINDAFLARYEPAKKLFDQLCKTAITTIHRTAENVEGILLLKMRPQGDVNVDMKDPMWPGAALAGERKGNWYLSTFLFDIRREQMVEEVLGVNGHGRKLQGGELGTRGFHYVDSIDANNGKRYRHRLIREQIPGASSGSTQFSVSSELATDAAPKYAVTFEDSVEPELRNHWIAGTKLKIIDTNTGETIAERKYYAFDDGLGDTKMRLPWAQARVCTDKYAGTQSAQTRMFVESVIKPQQGK